MTNQKSDPFFRNLAIGMPLGTVMGVATLLGCAPKPEVVAMTTEAKVEETAPAPERRWPPDAPADLCPYNPKVGSSNLP